LEVVFPNRVFLAGDGIRRGLPSLAVGIPFANKGSEKEFL